jgi:hypothetical protein
MSVFGQLVVTRVVRFYVDWKLPSTFSYRQLFGRSWPQHENRPAGIGYCRYGEESTKIAMSRWVLFRTPFTVVVDHVG